MEVVPLDSMRSTVEAAKRLALMRLSEVVPLNQTAVAGILLWKMVTEDLQLLSEQHHLRAPMIALEMPHVYSNLCAVLAEQKLGPSLLALAAGHSSLDRR